MQITVGTPKTIVFKLGKIDGFKCIPVYKVNLLEVKKKKTNGVSEKAAKNSQNVDMATFSFMITPLQVHFL